MTELGIAELASCAYSDKQKFDPPLSEKTREVFRSRLSSAFARLTRRREDFAKLCDIVLCIDTGAIIMSDEVRAEQSNAMKALRKLLKTSKKSDKKETGASVGLALLYAITILQLYDGAPDAISILHDLQSCSEKVRDSDAGTSEMLVEILLSLISRPSVMMRQASQQVFEAFTAQMSPEALQLLTEPLLAEENTKGYQALFENLEDEEMVDADGTDHGEEDEDDDIEEDDISEIGSDVEFVTLNGEGVEDDEDDDGSDDENDEEGGQAEAGQDYAALDEALAKVLKSHRLDRDKDADSESDSDMTDSEMMALDPKLGEVFKHTFKKLGGKTERKNHKEAVLNFKRRALDLLDIYVKHEAANPIAFGVILPLLHLVRTTGDKPLSNKATNTILDFTKALKKARAGNDSREGGGQQPSKAGAPDAEQQLELLRNIHREAAQDPSHAFARAASAASLLVASSLFAADRQSFRRIATIYADTQADWVMGKVRLQPVIFSDWTNWCQAQAANAQQA